MWFEALTGFSEDEVEDVAAMFAISGDEITSTVNGRTMRVGRFETPTLGELRQRAVDANGRSATLTLREVVADAQALHREAAHSGAVFQVASQFNTLEMVSPSVTPEAGIDGYEHDRTQGPACAVACGAGTIHRNYLVPVDGGIGQTATRQIDCLADVATALGVDLGMRNGYALPEAEELARVADAVATMSEGDLDLVRAQLRIGLQHETEVTLVGAGHTVTQAYCSAVPVAYSGLDPEMWEPFARLVLQAAYEATLAAAVVNVAATGNRTVFLTLLGGGVFGNPTSWITDAIARAAAVFADTELDVAVVSYGRENPALSPLLADFD
jgi:hypothetical protein